MSLIAPKSYVWSVVGLVVGGAAGFFITHANEPELAVPGGLAGAVGGLLLAGLVRTILRR